jgi:hypothetical protein
MPCADHVVLRLYRLALGDFKAKMDAKAGRIRAGILKELASEVLERNLTTKQHFDAVIARVNVVPTNAEELASLQAYAEGLQAEVSELQIEILETQKSLDVLEEFCYDISEDDYKTFWTAFGQPTNVAAAQQESVQRQEESRLKFMQVCRRVWAAWA